jgi:hypothetical protein
VQHQPGLEGPRLDAAGPLPATLPIPSCVRGRVVTRRWWGGVVNDFILRNGERRFERCAGRGDLGVHVRLAPDRAKLLGARS